MRRPAARRRRALSWSLSALLLLACPAFALDRFQVEGYLLPNGLQLILKPGDERSHVAIRLVVGVGFDDFSCADQELPHLLEHLLFSGVDDTGEGGLEAKMQALGGEWNAYTSNADTTFVIEAPARNQRKVLDLLLKVVTHTRLDEKALETSRRIVEREDGGHYTHLQKLLDRPNQGQGAGSQLARELGLKCAEPATAEALTLDQVEQVRQHWYAPNNMSLIVVGGLDKLLPAYLERTWGSLEAVEPSEHQALLSLSQEAKHERTLRRGWLGDGARLHWFFVEPVLETENPQTLDLLQSYLDWALYNDLRLQHGLSYGPYVQRESYGDSGLMSLNADLDHADVEQAKQVLTALFERLNREGLDPTTFNRLKQLALARQAWAAQGNSALADYYWGAMVDYADGRFADPAQGLRQVTLEESNQVLRHLLGSRNYLRIEKPWLAYDQLVPLAFVAIVLVALLAGLLRLLRKRRRVR
ncbi:M16 family metallopeptidase [Pseudomonas sp. nanlin1]|uniref:M16 family metallopeptidase n=1 Tax=Pseudomonas sp. nanlin1 TaxID=3040605 RepID=UPI00388E0547